jgi:hypothetical protein
MNGVNMKISNSVIWIALGFSFVSTVMAHEGHVKNDFSGIYDCHGMDTSEGHFMGKVTITLQPKHSKDNEVSYTYLLEVPGFGSYKGFAAAQGMDAAIYFALDDKTNEDYGVGIAKFYKEEGGPLQFHKYYFEPGYKGGNTGTEDCIRQEKN